MTEFTDLDFDHVSPSFFFIDKKAGLKLSLGTVGKLEPRHADMADRHGGIMLALLSNGMDQDLLDKLCLDLQADCGKHDVGIVITKSRRDFDRQWYLFGDLRGMLVAARADKVRLPFGPFLIDDIDNAITRLWRPGQ